MVVLDMQIDPTASPVICAGCLCQCVVQCSRSHMVHVFYGYVAVRLHLCMLHAAVLQPTTCWQAAAQQPAASTDLVATLLLWP